VRVSGVTRDIAHDGKLAFRRCQRSLVDEGRNLGGKVDTVDENVRLDDLLVWSWLRLGFGEIPLLSKSVLKSAWRS
jgi:hypothetical protein